VGQDVGVVAAGFFEGIAQDWKPVEGTLIVNGLGQFREGGTLPGKPIGIHNHGPEGVAENVPEQAGQFFCLSLPRMFVIRRYVLSYKFLTNQISEEQYRRLMEEDR
jgi:hypothetical protein